MSHKTMWNVSPICNFSDVTICMYRKCKLFRSMYKNSHACFSMVKIWPNILFKLPLFMRNPLATRYRHRMQIESNISNRISYSLYSQQRRSFTEMWNQIIICPQKSIYVLCYKQDAHSITVNARRMVSDTALLILRPLLLENWTTIIKI